MTTHTTKATGFVDMRLHKKLAVTSNLEDRREVDMTWLDDDIIGFLLVRKTKSEHANTEVEYDETI